MKRALAILAVLACAATASATAFDWPNTGAFGRPRRRVSPAAFLLSSLPAPSAPATITPQAGPAFACSRASTATYQTSATTLATAAANTCRVDYRGLLVEESRTNSALQSDALGASPWSKLTSSGNTLSITTDGTLGPDGAGANLFTATGTVSGAGTDIILRQTVGSVTVGSYTISAWTRQGSFNPFPFDYGGGSSNFSAATSAAWSRFAKTISYSGTLFVDLGANGSNGQTMSAGTLYLADVQSEAGAFATSYIPTTTTATTRAADQIDLGAITLPAAYSMSSTVNPEGLSGTETSLYFTDGTHMRSLSVDSSGHAVCGYDATTDSTTSTLSAGSATKIACKYDGAKVYACLAGTCTSGTTAASDGATAMSHAYLGWNGSGNYANSFISTVCAGPSARCQP